jgi:hypothetical protein
MYIRKAVAILVLASILLTSTVSIFAENTSDLQLMADKLNKIGVLAGDGKGDYNLDGNLKRTEAVTFITKLMGKATYVQENKDSLKKTIFSDVKQTDWFAPYVGFCYINDIVDGSNGKFGVKDNLTEQAFLVMLLKLLKYTGTDDIKWNNNVFKLAYDAGLVTDQVYLTKTKDDSLNYNRGEATKVMFKALGLKLKGENQTLIQSLVASGAIKREVAISSGILIDTVVTKIDEVSSVNGRRVVVKFNEAINSIDEKNIKIYEVDNKNNNLTVSVISFSGNKLEIGTNTQLPNKIYKVEILNSQDLEGNISAELNGTFNGYTVVAVQSDLFKISKVEQVGKSELNTYFTQPINENIEYSPYYEIYEGDQLYANGDVLTVRVAGVNNVASIILKGKIFSPDKEYTLKILGEVTGAYGTNLGDGLGDTVSFIGKDMTQSSLKLEKITALNSKSIKLDFNRQIHPLRAQQVYNYSVTDSAKKAIEVTNAAVLSDSISAGKSVILTLKTVLNKDMTYNIMINEIQDSTKEYNIEETSFTFSGNYTDIGILTIKNIEAIDAGTVKVTFDKAIDYNSGLDTKFYQLTNMTLNKDIVPAKIKFASNDQTSVKLYLKESDYLIGNTPYRVKVASSLKDYTGDTLLTNIDQAFLVKEVVSARVKISEAKIVGKDTVRITFNKEISADASNLKPQNYSIEYIDQGRSYKKVPIAVTYFDDLNVVIRFDKLDSEGKYTLVYKTIKDYAGNEILSNDGDKIDIVKGQ